MEWLTSSRYLGVLETQLKQQREDFTVRLAEKDAEIRRLRAANVHDRIEPVAIPSVQDIVRKDIQRHLDLGVAPLDWQGELSKLMQEEEIPDVTHG